MLVGGIVVGLLAGLLERLAVRLIVDPQAALFLHRAALVVEVRLVDVERAHAIALEEERQLELVRRHGLVVERAVLVRRPVHRAAVGEDERGMLAGPDVLGALEHHVLEEVREAGASRFLVGGPDEVVDDHRHGRRGVVFRDDDPQAVLELDVGELDQRPVGGAHRHDGQKHRHETPADCAKHSSSLKLKGGARPGLRQRAPWYTDRPAASRPSADRL